MCYNPCSSVPLGAQFWRHRRHRDVQRQQVLLLRPAAAVRGPRRGYHCDAQPAADGRAAQALRVPASSRHVWEHAPLTQFRPGQDALSGGQRAGVPVGLSLAHHVHRAGPGEVCALMRKISATPSSYKMIWFSVQIVVALSIFTVATAFLDLGRNEGGGGGHRCQYYVKYYVMYTVSCRWILSKPFHQIKPCSTMRGKLKYYTCTVCQYFAIEYFASIYCSGYFTY